MAKTLDPSPQTRVRRSPSAKSLTMAESDAVMQRPLVESPTAIRADLPSVDSTNGTSSLHPSRDSDAASLASTNQNGTTKDKKRPWRKSTARKPTGLAGAIAASGMAMAQPTLSAIHQASFSATMQAQAQPNAPSTSTTRKSSINSPPRSPRGSVINHARGKSSEFSPHSTRSKRSGAGRASVSVQSDNASEYYPDDRPDYYSGLDESSDEDEGLEGESMLDEMEDMPVTGFAVASNKRNADFHDLFPTVPEGDYLIEDYGCALQREILIQGRLYISENHICFHANIFGWITNMSIPMCEVTQLDKRMTAFVIPNAIQVTTRQAKYTFASFLSRDTTYDVIYNIWRLAKPDDAINSSRPSFDGASVVESNPIQGNGEGALLRAPKITTCACAEGGHYHETAMDCVLPGTPDRIHNLIFASAFIKEFMTVDQKLTDIQISDWQPTEPGSALLTRNMSYIKPLHGSVGPRSTKCEITDLMVYKDSEHYISTDTTTRTPDVPSGGVFSVKTKTCLTWASSLSTRIVVTTEVQWTGRSFIKSIIEKSAIEGQKTWHRDLEIAMRAYIQEHQAEFVPEGVDASALPASPNPNVPPTPGEVTISSKEANKRREHERNRRGLQWAWDTFEGASQVAIRSTKDAFELVCDAWEQSSSTTIMWFVIVGLVLSNLWSLFLMGSREEAGRRKEMKKMEEREKWVQGVVRALWDELSKQQPHKEHLSMPSDGISWVAGLAQSQPVPAATWSREVEDMQGVLDQLEERIKLLNEGLKVIRTEGGGIDSLD
ncbi:hypothetical protein AGABI1DRAFT_67583 [Agaricus bisporus var. burnettii JB137-S8]|nr:uncharacterized protein AGABI1DRAFT_67583 [Agaricus bisporus var. burnettii JB137-S8]EKM84241.1 hypothetical protein AGABI1DRAFT_67583 [Agaricus bisporus var. burnettii JB137-S8]